MTITFGAFMGLYTFVRLKFLEPDRPGSLRKLSTSLQRSDCGLESGSWKRG